MKKIRLSVSMLVLNVLLVSLAIAAVPGRINFQGRLLDQNKNPKSGLFTMTFSIWDTGPGTGGSQIWSETQNNVQVTNGMFAVQLGAVTALTSEAFSSDTRWLQIQVGSEVLEPRERLVSSPYSFRASTAEAVIAGAVGNNEISAAANISWTKIDKTGSSIADFATRSASDLNSGTLSADRGGTGISGAGGTSDRILLTTDGSAWSAGQVSPGSMVSAGTLPSNVIASSVAVNAVGESNIIDGSVGNNDIASGAGIAWTKIDKTGSSMADLATRSAGDLNSGTLPSGRLNGNYLTDVLVSSAMYAAPAPGTLILLSADETDTSGTATQSSVKSYNAASNSYSRIMVEAQIGLEHSGNSTGEWNFVLAYGGTNKETATLATSGSHSGDSHKLSGTVKYSEAFTAGGTVQLNVTAVSANGTWYVKSFRVFGIK